MTKREKTIFTSKNPNVIREFLSSKNEFLHTIASKNYDDILLICKSISHSDIPFAKRTNKNDNYDKNLLYYTSSDESKELGLDETAHQTSINPGAEFFKFLNILLPNQRRNNPTNENIANFADIFVINDDNLQYFSNKYTKLVIEKLGKTIPKNSVLNKCCFSYENSDLIKIPSLSLSAHGFAASRDKFFHSLRANIFKGDFLHILLTKKDKKYTIYFLLEKNPKFYSITMQTNAIWEKCKQRQLEIDKLKLVKEISNEKLAELTEKTRRFQNAWRQKLADEAIAYTKNDTIICPISGIEASRDNFLTLFRASHIKSFLASENNLEAYDINNGLLLSANIDALFDKHLITINSNRELKLSFLFENESEKLLDDLRIQKNQKISKYFLNDKKMEFMAWHYEQFELKEKERMNA